LLQTFFTLFDFEISDSARFERQHIFSSVCWLSDDGGSMDGGGSIDGGNVGDGGKQL
jgi:hypothetical protein